jgi:hypothetical protein
MRCRVVICAACSTRLDGINHCHACVKRLGQRAQRKSTVPAPVALVACLLLGLSWVLFAVLFWFLQGTLAP